MMDSLVFSTIGKSGYSTVRIVSITLVNIRKIQRFFYTGLLISKDVIYTAEAINVLILDIVTDVEGIPLVGSIVLDRLI